MNEEKILKTIENHFPKNLYYEDDNYQNSEEYNKLKTIVGKSDANIEWWGSFKTSLQDKFKDYQVEDWTQFFNSDRCYRVRIWLTNFEALMIHISVLGMYSAIYSSSKFDKLSIPKISFENLQHSDMIEYIDTELEKINGALRLSPKLLNTIVPNVAIGNTILGETTIFDCLFTDHKF